jgi:hypothetical protein
MRRVFYILMAISTISCEQRAKTLELRRANTINGEVIHQYRGNELVFVCKEELCGEKWAIMLNNDTIRFGEKLRGTFVLPDTTCAVVLEEPKQERLKSREKMFHFFFKPEEDKIYDFVGYLECDGKIERFEYQFYVKKGG